MGVPAAVFCFRFLVSGLGLGMMAVSKVEKKIGVLKVGRVVPAKLRR